MWTYRDELGDKESLLRLFTGERGASGLQENEGEGRL